ncbi:hypothetical protein DL762_003987 [Monosporascus cannonballus]|uniref:Uncharacterized protein n=1 Tax=Monosporascus cannonballus TaxID=155416 RepID=A0ABY0HD78_9PEZI|nr:hypothetical protein DL762_003987 [Monosporascus cannonballus]
MRHPAYFDDKKYKDTEPQRGPNFPGVRNDMGYGNMEGEDSADEDDLGIGDAVLASVSDLKLAASLIVELYKEHAQDQECKIGGWQKAVITCRGSHEHSANQQPSDNSPTDRDHGNSRKRRRLGGTPRRGSNDDDWEEKDEGDGDDSPPNPKDGLNPVPLSNRMFACPFHKVDPERFCINEATNIEFRTVPARQGRGDEDEVDNPDPELSQSQCENVGHGHSFFDDIIRNVSWNRGIYVSHQAPSTPEEPYSGAPTVYRELPSHRSLELNSSKTIITSHTLYYLIL